MSEEPVRDVLPHVEGHEGIGAFNMELEFRNKIEAEARDAVKALDEANTRIAAIQSDHDSMKAALDVERKSIEDLKAQLAYAQAEAAKVSGLEAELADLRAAAAKVNEEKKYGADAEQGTSPAV